MRKSALRNYLTNCSDDDDTDGNDGIFLPGITSGVSLSPKATAMKRQKY